MKINNLKIMALTTALSMPILCCGDSTYKLNKIDRANAACMTYDDNDSFEDELVNLTTTSTFTTTTTTVTTTSIVTTTTSIVTTKEVIDEFRDIRKYENLKNNDLSIEELDSFIKRYSSLAKLSYEDALKVIDENIDSIENDYNSIRGGIMCSLFSYSCDNGILSPYAMDKETRVDMTQEEKENIMIEFCNNLGLNSDDISIVISVFREETGNGTSSRCVNDNNYGGIRIYGEAGCNGEYGIYSTPEFGIYRQVKCVSNKLLNIRGDGINDLNSVVYSFACRYNPQYADTYSSKIMGWLYNVQSDYGDFSDKTESKCYTKK